MRRNEVISTLHVAFKNSNVVTISARLEITKVVTKLLQVTERDGTLLFINKGIQAQEWLMNTGLICDKLHLPFMIYHVHRHARHAWK